MRPGLLPPWGSSLIYVLSTISVIFLILTYYKIIQRLCLAFAIGPSRRRQLRRNSRRQRRTNENNLIETPSQVQSVGLASAVIHSLPAIQFREEIKKGGDQDNTDCAVCLGEFGEGEWLRLLPNCAHVFHVACIDTWFRAHSTCPLCRMDVLYDFSSCSSSSVSVVALLATLRREDPYDERPLGHRLLDTATMQNPEYRLGAISSQLLETDSDESFPAISPIIVPNSIATGNQLELPQNHKGESSRGERNEQAMSASPEVSH